MPPTDIPQISTSVHFNSPISATKQYAHMYVSDLLDSLDDARSQNDKVLFGHPITRNFQKVPLTVSPVPPPTWSSAMPHPEPDPDSLEMLRLWSSTSGLLENDRKWIIHNQPRYVVLTAEEVVASFCNIRMPTSPSIDIQIKQSLSADAVDVVLRRFNQIDSSILLGSPGHRWRHFIESDLAMMSFAGVEPKYMQSVFNQFVNCSYPVPQCRMIVVPVLIDGIWAAYLFNTHELKAHIVDVVNVPYRLSLHQHFFKIVAMSIRCCASMFFQSWEFAEPTEWEINYPLLCPHDIPSYYSGVAMLVMARHFNGDSLDVQISKDYLDRARLLFMYEALSLGGNEAECHLCYLGSSNHNFHVIFLLPPICIRHSYVRRKCLFKYQMSLVCPSNDCARQFEFICRENIVNVVHWIPYPTVHPYVA